MSERKNLISPVEYYPELERDVIGWINDVLDNSSLPLVTQLIKIQDIIGEWDIVYSSQFTDSDREGIWKLMVKEKIGVDLDNLPEDIWD